MGSQTTEQTAQGDTMSITKLKNKLFNDKYREELNKVHQELEEQEIEINNEIVSADNLTELDDIDIQSFVMNKKHMKVLIVLTALIIWRYNE